MAQEIVLHTGAPENVTQVPFVDIGNHISTVFFTSNQATTINGTAYRNVLEIDWSFFGQKYQSFLAGDFTFDTTTMKPISGNVYAYFEGYSVSNFTWFADNLNVPIKNFTDAITGNAADPNSSVLWSIILSQPTTFIGSTGADTITGGNSADTLTPGGGNDIINGGGGINTAIYAGTLKQYTIANNAGVITITDSLSARDGTDTLTNIQHIQFTDYSINTTMKAEAAKLPTATVNSIVELYVAYFARTPDATGLAYWIDKAAGGESLTAISKEFYNAGVQFSSLTGYSATMANADFIKLVYTNVLGRSGATAPPDADVAYWDNQIKIGATTKEGLIQTMLTAAHSFANDPTWGWVPKLLDNKISVGYQAAVTYGLDYNSSSDAITQGMAIAHAVTSSDTTAAVGLIGVAGHVLL